MNRSANFWILMVVLQVVFGLSVFAITREYYVREQEIVREAPIAARQPSLEWSDRISQLNPPQLNSLASNQPRIQNPVEISRQADEFFANRQYDKAADMYEQLLALSPSNVEIHNNLGLTLHYLGRSTEALRRLNEGVAADPANQRIWLTLGFVNSQLGHTEQARTALTTAMQIGADESIRQSAIKMLENLP